MGTKKTAAEKTPAKKAPEKVTLKTQATKALAQTFLESLSSASHKSDSLRLVEMMEKATGTPAVMWGSAIVGFGDRVYRSPATSTAGALEDFVAQRITTATADG